MWHVIHVFYLFKDRRQLPFSALAVFLVTVCAFALGQMCIHLAYAPFMETCKLHLWLIRLWVFLHLQDTPFVCDFWRHVLPCTLSQSRKDSLFLDYATMAHIGNMARKRLHFQVCLIPLLGIQGLWYLKHVILHRVRFGTFEKWFQQSQVES